jgi:hypothetical protein
MNRVISWPQHRSPPSRGATASSWPHRSSRDLTATTASFTALQSRPRHSPAWRLETSLRCTAFCRVERARAVHREQPFLRTEHRRVHAALCTSTHQHAHHSSTAEQSERLGRRFQPRVGTPRAPSPHTAKGRSRDRQRLHWSQGSSRRDGQRSVRRSQGMVEGTGSTAGGCVGRTSALMSRRLA